MRIALAWLMDRLGCSLNVNEVEATLTSMGLEVEKIEGILPLIEGVVVAQVESVMPHPNASRLQIARIYDGHQEYSVVCGAPNCRPGIRVPFAQVGAQLPEMLIVERSIRGVNSSGMLCALDELGCAGSSEIGIHELPAETPLGVAAMPLLQDPIFHLNLTPDLGHGLSIEGVARALAARLRLSLPEKSWSPLTPSPFLKMRTVSLEAQEVIEYTAVMFDGVSVGPSPDWLRKEMERAGWRSVNEWVDLGNWLMLVTGMPVHLFDDDKIEGGLVVRRGREGETLALLTGHEQKLGPQSLVIADAQGPIALAGIMGGQRTQIGQSTRRILLEIACFDSVALRRSVKATGISSEASKRFERGVPTHGAYRLLEHWVACLSRGVYQAYSAPHYIKVAPPARYVELRERRAQTYLGPGWSLQQIADSLSYSLDEVKIVEDRVCCRVPFYRHDLVIEEDLIDELIKLVGAEKLQRTPITLPLPTQTHDPRYRFFQRLRNELVGVGLQEVQSLDLVAGHRLQALGIESTQVMALLDPPSSEASVLRPHLLSALLPLVEGNSHTNVAFFEMGSSYDPRQGEQEMLAILLMGDRFIERFDHPPRQVDFYDLKGILETLLQRLHIGIGSLEVGPDPTLVSSWLHPKQQVSWQVADGQTLLRAGAIHPRITAHYQLSSDAFYSEIDLRILMQSLPSDLQYEPESIYPSSTRDWTITLPESIHYTAWMAPLKQAERGAFNLVDSELLAIWRSAQLGSDRKNVTLRLHYRAKDKTLTQEGVDESHHRVQELLRLALPVMSAD